MLLMKIFYAILIIVCIIFYVMYLWDFALVLLITVIAIPIILFVAMLIAKHSISVDFSVKEDTVMKNESFPVLIKILNRSIIPVGRAEAHIEYGNVFSGELDDFILYLPIQARNEQSVVFQLRSGFCGIADVKCSGIYIYDPLKIFRFRVSGSNSIKIAVMPECHEISGQVMYTDKVKDESDIFSEHKPGDDPSEIFDLRGYNPGDKLNKIHWKLSSKKDEFIVKDYSLPIDVPCTVFLDLKCQEGSGFTLPVFDTLVESLVSISQFMIENERIHTIVYYNFKSGSFEEKRICDADSLTAAIREMILSLDCTKMCQSAEHYFVEHTGFSLSSLVFITSRPDPAVMGYIDDNIDADIKNAVVVLSAEKEDIPAAYSGINIIPVVMGKIASSIKDIEV